MQSWGGVTCSRGPGGATVVERCHSRENDRGATSNLFPFQYLSIKSIDVQTSVREKPLGRSKLNKHSNVRQNQTNSGYIKIAIGCQQQSLEGNFKLCTRTSQRDLDSNHATNYYKRRPSTYV